MKALFIFVKAYSLCVCVYDSELIKSDLLFFLCFHFDFFSTFFIRRFLIYGFWFCTDSHLSDLYEANEANRFDIGRG